ncbi:16S rRNA (guanine(966)-N(2))-methyltransferase RsmD [Aerococcaceae bacterium NML191292]|nr:16S rRNA (guanine(966)-N(2))-methyltransferase RsmD [Aerococcaceae bacterium NML191292]MCW6667030.1 16S rRNA (guanine(966)-N(2))-methyltransferase RsmD [Aerococcaceae bacterium NML190938]MCW6681462.1 16S rRNA (guanine(966)-N(2))-methyltransferase RsmD [Aerococcaceae bacterium NML160702]
MRVIAGQYGSRHLKAVPGMNTRPTTDKIKEGIFNLLGGYFDGGVCLDFYGGSGGMAIEAVSRGMERAIITEKYRPALQTIKANVAVTKEEHKFTVLSGDNRASLAQLKQREPDLIFDLVILDPPYQQQRIVEDIEWLADLGVIDYLTGILCESDDQLDLPEEVLSWRKVKQKQYGQTGIHLYEGSE